ncbi:unnamed protein product, partial [Arctogadus glacialis]
MLEHEPGGTDRRRVQQITAAGMKIQQPGMCSGGGADHGGCKGGDGGCDRGVSLQRPPEEGAPGEPGGQGSPRAIAGRLSSGSADRELSSGSYNASTGTFYSCVSQITIGFDGGGQVAIGISHWSSPFPAAAGRALPSPDCVHSEATYVPPISGDP